MFFTHLWRQGWEMSGVIFIQKLFTAQVQSQNRLGVSFTEGVHLPACKVACDFWTVPCLMRQSFYRSFLQRVSMGIPRSGISQGKPYTFSLQDQVYHTLTDWKEY